jgi:hypothetical protein
MALPNRCICIKRCPSSSPEISIEKNYSSAPKVRILHHLGDIKNIVGYVLLKHCIVYRERQKFGIMEIFSFFLSFSKITQTGQFSLKVKTMWQLQIKILRTNFHKNKFFKVNQHS